MMLKTLETITRWFSRALMLAGALGLLAMTAAIGWQVFGRYVLNASPAWTEQSALVLMVWFAMFSAAAGVHQGFHIRIGVLVEMAPRRIRLVCRAAALLVIIACSAALTVWGAELVARTWSHTIPTLGLPRGVAYLPLPASGALMVLFALERLAELAAGHERERMEGAV
jgi:TRAP-type C4-dicarboxylate transport system permease small subunit